MIGNTRMLLSDHIGFYKALNFLNGRNSMSKYAFFLTNWRAVGDDLE